MPGAGDGSSQVKCEGWTNVWTQDVSRWSYNDNTSGAPSGLPAGAGTWLQLLSFTLDNIQISTQFEERDDCCWQGAVVLWLCLQIRLK